MRDPDAAAAAARASRTTVYARNTRAGARRVRQCEAGWAPAVSALVARDYAFLPLVYGDEGYLFRGIDSGLDAMWDGGALPCNQGAHSLAALEREAGVRFVSQDPSDALAVSRLWESPEDGAILLIPAIRFAAEHAAGRAAVLGFADPGVVFRYPFFSPEVNCELVSHVIVHPDRLVRARAGSRDLPVCVLAPTDLTPLATRATCATALHAVLRAQRLAPARPRHESRMPRLATRT